MTAKRHYTIVELQLPKSDSGFGTPKSGNGTASGTNVYMFTNYNKPMRKSFIEGISDTGQIPIGGVKKCLVGISENTTKLQPEVGLAIRGSGSIQLVDSVNFGDPNPFAPDVDEKVSAQGTFLQKLKARNYFANNPVKIHNFCEVDGHYETRHYLTDGFNSDGKGKWTLKLKSELSRVDIGEAVWPEEEYGYLRQDIDETATTLLVDPDLSYSINDVIRIGDELLKVTNTSNIGTGTAEITVQSRGSAIQFSGDTYSRTRAESHSGGDQIFKCYVAQNQHIGDLLYNVLSDVGIPTSRLPLLEWKAEIDTWLAGVTVKTIFYESMSVDAALKMFLEPYMLNTWYDEVERKVKVSAVNVWKESDAVLTEGNEIDFESIKVKDEENLRNTRSVIVYNKDYLTDPEEIPSYKNASTFIKPELELDSAFGESKIKDFGFNYIISNTAADLLVNRTTNRFSDPRRFTWKTQEVKLNYKVGDVATINTESIVDFNGLPSTISRAQILQIKPKYSDFGREYQVEALSYEPSFADNTEIVISGSVSNINLYTQYAGAPAGAVTITFIFDNVKASSNTTSTPSIVAGNFAAGSKIIIIMANGSELMSKGGNGAQGEKASYDYEFNNWRLTPVLPGENGGTVYDAQGVDTDIYFSGSTPSAAYPAANGYIIAPSGGDGGFKNTIPDLTSDSLDGVIAADGADGGDGSSPGVGGANGQVISQQGGKFGSNGKTGTSDRLSGSFGQNGKDNDSQGGIAGKGVIDNGATVQFFGSNSIRYINGTGDH
jgi:hypothetical protein